MTSLKVERDKFDKLAQLYEEIGKIHTLYARQLKMDAGKREVMYRADQKS
jgi:hypothetical protein